MANKKIFLDTNIVADMIDDKRENYSVSLSLLQTLMIQEYEIFISEDMLSTLYFISKDKKATLAFFENIIYTDWYILSYGKRVIKEATRISLSKGIDLEDTLQCLYAKENACTLLITRDKKFVDCGIQIVNYESFLNKIIPDRYLEGKK